MNGWNANNLHIAVTSGGLLTRARCEIQCNTIQWECFSAASGGGTAKRSTVVRFQSSEAPAPEDAAEGVGGDADAGNGSGGHPHRAVHPLHESHSTPAFNHLPAAAPNPRRESIAAALTTGNRRASVVAGNLLKQLQVHLPVYVVGREVGPLRKQESRQTR